MDSLTNESILAFLKRLGDHCPESAQIILLGGSALCLLGNPRPTLDIDYLGNDLEKDNFQRLIDQVANELHLGIDAVPLESFLPLPEKAAERHIFLKSFGRLDVYIFDPYTIALSKIERGFDTDIDDVVFLFQIGQIDLTLLENYFSKMLEQAGNFDLHPAEAKDHLEVVRRRII